MDRSHDRRFLLPILNMRIIHLVALAISCLPAQAQSGSGKQDWATVKALAPGTQILIAPKGPGDVKGKVEAVTDDSIRLKSGKREVTLLRGDILWLSVKVSRRKKHIASGTKRGAIIGAGIGVGVGLLCTAAAGSDGAVCYIAVPVGAGLYAVLGAALGAIGPAGEWREIYHQ
jgi:hypothetical protein